MTHELKKDIDNIKDTVSTNLTAIAWSHIWVWVVLFAVLGGIALTSLIAYASSYEHKVLYGVSVGSVHVGGMEREDLRIFLEDMNTKLLDAGITLTFEDQGKTQYVRIDPAIRSEDFFVELIRMDIDQEVETLLSYQKEGNLIVRGWSALLVRVSQPQLELQSVTLDKDQLTEMVASRLIPFETQAQDAGVRVIQTDPLEYEIVSSTVGVTFSYTDIIGRIISSWSSLTIPEITIVRTVEHPSVLEEDVVPLLGGLEQVFDAGNITLTYTNTTTKRTSEWKITPDDMASWIDVQSLEDGRLGFGLSYASTTAYLDKTIGETIYQSPKEARFDIGQNGKVSEFQVSQPGISLNTEATYQELNSAFLSRSFTDTAVSSTTFSIQVIAEKPEISTDEVNALGITELLGTGYSNFAGSPTNRVKNIRFAVKQKLHGTLIKPGEEFSLLNALKPFTIEGGYLAELVIKGDEIIPEIGGGLCQIGSTLFRAVMNAGLDVTQRRNHSLVVSYYNDHRNGKPGTDATIYDPAPDFRFKNDTKHYILLTTSMNESNGDLHFSFWGTSDGREAYYTEPVVHRWIPAGAPQVKETTALAPGVRDCQSAYRGAETSFTYVKVLPNGEREEEVFTSYYRPLPQICLVGKAAPSEGSGTVCEAGDTSCQTPFPEGTDSDPSQPTPPADPSAGEDETISTDPSPTDPVPEIG